jgi:hypothetical protein
MPEWMNMSEWLEPKLLVFIVLVATVLFLSRRGGGESAEPKRLGERQGRDAAILKDVRH